MNWWPKLPSMTPIKGLARFLYVWTHWETISADLEGYRRQIKDREDWAKTVLIELLDDAHAAVKRGRASQESKRPEMEKEAARLDAVVARLVDAVEAGQPVGDRLKQRKAELDALRLKLAEPEPVSNPRTVAGLAESLLARLGDGDPIATRQVLRRIGIDRIVVRPDGSGGWDFSGEADFSGVCAMDGRRGPSRPPPMI